jgi:hypothetical protein
MRPIDHGTIGGAAAHRRRGERPCALCLDAVARYQEGLDAVSGRTNHHGRSGR